MSRQGFADTHVHTQNRVGQVSFISQPGAVQRDWNQNHMVAKQAS